MEEKSMRNLLCTLFILSTYANTSLAQQPYQLGVQENVQGAGQSAYPAPQMMSVPAVPASKKPKKVIPAQATKNNSNLNGNLSNTNNLSNSPPQETFSAGITQVSLPPAFLGIWQVHGQRTNVEALPEFQAGAQQAFSTSNDQLWNISGSQGGGYTLGANTGISTALIVDKVQGNTAFVRYQHPVGNTMAQEAIVMSLRPGGAQFDGLERISIVKQGLSQPRAKVTYQLMGTRQ